MGISGLLPALASITKSCTVSSAFSGQTIGIDAYTWLHKATYSCAQDVAQGRDNRAFVRFCVQRTEMLRHYKIRPYFVFDGANLPAKAGTEEARRASRAAALAEACAALAAGRREDAQAAFSRAVDVTPALAHKFIEWLRAEGIPFVVAPYEADAQLAYLFKAGIITGVVTEDSDLLPFGVERVLFKMDREGMGQLVNLQDLPQCTELSFAGLTHDNFLSMCVLAGCDYLPSVNGFGVKMAHAFVRRHKTVDRILKLLHFEKGTAVPAGYDDAFKTARMTFLHQRVWCPRARRLVHLTPLPAELQGVDPALLNFLGPGMDDARAGAIADAIIDPTTLAPYPASAVPPSVGGGAGSSGSGGGGRAFAPSKGAAAGAAAAAAMPAGQRAITGFLIKTSTAAAPAPSASSAAAAAAAAAKAAAPAPLPAARKQPAPEEDLDDLEEGGASASASASASAAPPAPSGPLRSGYFGAASASSAGQTRPGLPPLPTRKIFGLVGGSKRPAAAAAVPVQQVRAGAGGGGQGMGAKESGVSRAAVQQLSQCSSVEEVEEGGEGAEAGAGAGAAAPSLLGYARGEKRGRAGGERDGAGSAAAAAAAASSASASASASSAAGRGLSGFSFPGSAKAPLHAIPQLSVSGSSSKPEPIRPLARFSFGGGGK